MHNLAIHRYPFLLFMTFCCLHNLQIISTAFLVCKKNNASGDARILSRLLYARVLGFLLSYLKILWLFWIYLRCDYSVMQKSASIERGAFSPFRWHKHSAIRCNKMLQFQSFWFSKFLWKFAAIGATFIWESSLYIGEIDGHMKNLPYISFKRNN